MGESVTLFSWVTEFVGDIQALLIMIVTEGAPTRLSYPGNIRVKILEGLTSLFCLVDTMLYFIM